LLYVQYERVSLFDEHCASAYTKIDVIIMCAT